MVAVLDPTHSARVIADLTAAGETAFVIGIIEPGPKGCTVFGAGDEWHAMRPWEATHVD